MRWSGPHCRVPAWLNNYVGTLPTWTTTAVLELGRLPTIGDFRGVQCRTVASTTALCQRRHVKQSLAGCMPSVALAICTALSERRRHCYPVWIPSALELETVLLIRSESERREMYTSCGVRRLRLCIYPTRSRVLRGAYEAILLDLYASRGGSNST